MAEPTPQDQIRKQITDRAGQALGSTQALVPVNVAGVGQFPYNYESANNIFSANTWTWINRLAVPTNGDVVGLGEPLTTRYDLLLGKLSYQLSKDDTAKKIKAGNDALEVAQQVVAQYEELYGTITPDQLTAAKAPTKIDYITAYMLAQWASPNKLQLTGDNIRNLTRQLPSLPPSAQTLISPITTYLEKMVSVLGLQNDVGNASFLLGNLLQNTEHATAGNGGLSTTDGKVHPGYTVSPAQGDIYNGLNSDRHFTITAKAKSYNENKVELQINGEAVVYIPIVDLFGIGGGGSVHYSLDQLSTERSTFQMEMTFKGITGVSFRPADYQEDTLSGWWYPQPLRDAFAHQGKDDFSGWALTPFPPDTHFAHLSFLAISQPPTIKVTFSSGRASRQAQTLESHSGVDISFLGIPIVASEQHYKSSKITENESGQGFSISFHAPQPSAGLLSQTAYVLGGEVEHPFNQLP
ncbi:hypothetical protein [Streptomyces sp. NPDC101150]|uniref:hypothetical protein n=1 Tax=Streptomyces sp. NPDC101150 TaxID=3366114 RepID=UPI003813243D